MNGFVLACLLCVIPASVRAQQAEAELDHVFVLVEPGAAAEVGALRAAGLFVDTAVTRHTGQGTASHSVVFENAYLELIWVDSGVPVAASAEALLPRMVRASDWRSTGASPFGVGLRRPDGAAELPVPSTPYTAEWMFPGSAIHMLVQDDEPDAFEVFVIPAYMAVPVWIDHPMGRRLRAHPAGARRVTAVEIHGPRAHEAAAARAIDITPFRYVEADSPLLVLELDGGAAGTTIDLRPGAPVLIRR